MLLWLIYKAKRLRQIFSFLSEMGWAREDEIELNLQIRVELSPQSNRIKALLLIFFETACRAIDTRVLYCFFYQFNNIYGKAIRKVPSYWMWLKLCRILNSLLMAKLSKNMQISCHNPHEQSLGRDLDYFIVETKFGSLICAFLGTMCMHP